MLVAITGTIGSGKTYILKQIHNLYNYDVFSADDFVKDSYHDENIKQELHKVFNCLVDGKVDKNIIKFKLNDENILKLNQIIHPFVIEKIKQLKITYQNSLAFIEVPLLYECNLETLFDKVIAISIDDKLRHQRLQNRNAKAFQEMLLLEKKQFDNKQKCQKADYILYGSENDVATLEQLNDIINKIN